VIKNQLVLYTNQIPQKVVKVCKSKLILVVSTNLTVLITFPRSMIFPRLNPR